ncbi:MAG: hypothetical protein PHG87_02660 [Candidatus Omnitrophica bacterium]|nr:hypothetical protein [Candidatus Omnitrophota bacterium]
MAVQKLRLVLDESLMPRGKAREVETLGMEVPAGGVTYEKPPENIEDLIVLKNPPLINVLDVTNAGGKELSPEAKSFVKNGYNFYQANVGVNLGPSTNYKFIQAELHYELSQDKDPRLNISDIFPQTTYEEKLRISGSVGLDLGMNYSVPVAGVPLSAEAKAKFAIEPQPWVWKVATIQSTGRGTLKARWIFRVNETVADLQTSIVIMTKLNPPILLKIGGWIEIYQGFWENNFYYRIDPAQVRLEE